ncbi:MAG: HEPN domain-containing protein [Chloroflexi bacterium]|nr:HEPN domain-containing protein [Chloroflexota bacterium]
MLFKKGYREKSHGCLKSAIQALFVDGGIMDQEYVDDFDTTMLLRETADYKSDFSKEGAETAIDNAERFLAKTEEILSLK